MQAHDEIPDEVRAVIALFKRELNGVAFPEVDAGSLERMVGDARAAAAEVERAREALAAAQVACDARRAALIDSARRAIAYARIYADGHPDRAALRDALAEPVAPATVTAKRRGRPPKAAAELFDVRLPDTAASEN